MKKYIPYVYGIGLIILLMIVGRFADDLLFFLINFFELDDIKYIRTYVLLVSVITLLTGCVLIFSAKSARVDAKIGFRILLGAICGGIGTVWLLMVFIAPDF